MSVSYSVMVQKWLPFHSHVQELSISVIFGVIFPMASPPMMRLVDFGVKSSFHLSRVDGFLDFDPLHPVGTSLA